MMNENTNKTIEISKILKDLGMSPALRGYEYARYAIGLLLEDMSLARHITTKLYPMCAERFGTTWQRVERNIRHSIESAWMRGNTYTQDALFGYTVEVDKGKPTNGEFLATVADYLQMT